MPGKLNVLDCDPACTSCIKSYKKKHDLTKVDTFDIGCMGIPKNYISEDMAKALSDENTRSMLSMLDPVTWAKEKFGYEDLAKAWSKNLF